MSGFNKETGATWGRIGGTTRSARHDPQELAKSGQRGLMNRFEREVDPEGVLDPAEREIRAKRLRRAWLLRLSVYATRARVAKAQERRAAREAAEADGTA